MLFSDTQSKSECKRCPYGAVSQEHSSAASRRGTEAREEHLHRHEQGKQMSGQVPHRREGESQRGAEGLPTPSSRAPRKVGHLEEGHDLETFLLQLERVPRFLCCKTKGEVWRGSQGFYAVRPKGRLRTLLLNSRAMSCHLHNTLLYSDAVYTLSSCR